ncbi:MAG: ParB/RepB/Spo0J family partition protein [Leptolyngbya sp. SIOISBB]|nr:ParB/RepB/Spo0J family partition protein [Leptolyngbya sp. SIOISBB]
MLQEAITEQTETPFLPVALTPIAQNQKPEKVAAFREIAVIKIHEPKWMPRKCKHLQQLEDLTASVKKKGIVVPILVRPLETDSASDVYELVAGSRRLAAARKAGLKTVPAIVRPLTDQEALHHALMENTLRQDLSAIEQTEAIIDLLQQALNMPQAEIINLFQRIAHNSSVLQNNVIQRKWGTVLGIFSALGKNWRSFRSNDLPMLGWPEDVKVAVRMQQIAPSKARIIARIEDPSKRQAVLNQAINEAATVNDIKTMRREIEGGPNSELCAKDLKAKAETLWANLKQSAVWDCPEKKEKLAGLLRQMHRLMQEPERADERVG